jgi:hypothetical protein
MKKNYLKALFLRDITYSFSYSKYKYIIFYSLILVLSVAESLPLKSFGSNSVGTFYFLLKDEGYFFHISDYIIPTNWLFVQFVTLFLISDYLVHDMETNQHYILLRIQNKAYFILSKQMWIILQTILIFLGVFIVIYLVSSLVLGDFSLGLTSFYQDTILAQMNHPLTPISLILQLFIRYVITSIVLTSILLLCSQLVAPIISFFSVIFLGALSTFLDWKWLPAIHSMILKSEVFDGEHHLSLPFSLTYLLIIYLFVSILTYFVYKKKNII